MPDLMRAAYDAMYFWLIAHGFQVVMGLGLVFWVGVILWLLWLDTEVR